MAGNFERFPEFAIKEIKRIYAEVPTLQYSQYAIGRCAAVCNRFTEQPSQLHTILCYGLFYINYKVDLNC